ncbi:hypothetical protein M0813_06370 [Anaeramoeba flamelloides]|uniref:C2H2-type domain-containing protein n=1 Tax=Anaeramoeba flamelloides TaxID=1746091 RepID=A0ABQ8XDS2_9EUKA|nr:hypothetical protein M0813_06370 [Anaeramoeba flamelloides]
MLQINHRCKYCCENFSRLSQLEKHTLTKHKIILTKTINDKRSQNKKYNQKNNKIEEKEIPQDDKHMGYEFTDIDIDFEESDILFEKQKDEQDPPTFGKFKYEVDEKWIDFYLLTLESKISSRIAERILTFINKFFLPKSGNQLPKTMRTINKYLTKNINIKKASNIDITLNKLFDKNSQLVIEKERIKTKYYSPITWLNLFVNSKLLNTLVKKEDLNKGIPVHEDGYIPTKISSTAAFQEKIQLFPDVGADVQIMLGFLL